MDIGEKVAELTEKVSELEEKNKELRKRNQQLEDKVERHLGEGEQAEEMGEEAEELNRRQFMKMLGLGAGGLALSSAASGVGWSVLQPQSSGTSDIEAATATAAAGNFDLQGNSLTDTTRAFVDIGANNLHLATGQAIEDGSGVNRMGLETSRTVIRGENGNARIGTSSTDVSLTAPSASGNNSARIYDGVGDFRSVQYFPSSNAPGMLELTNAELTLPIGDLTLTSAGRIHVDNSSTTSNYSQTLEFTTGYNGLTALVQASENTGSGNAEIIADDSAGNRTTLT